MSRTTRGNKKVVKEFEPGAFVKPGVTIDDVKEVKEAFDFFDLDKAGEISLSEFVESLKTYGFDQKNPEVYRIIEEMLNEGSGG